VDGMAAPQEVARQIDKALEPAEKAAGPAAK